MPDDVAPVVLKRKPRWWMHPQMLVRMMGIKDNNGRPIFLGALEAPSYGAIGNDPGLSGDSGDGRAEYRRARAR